MSMLPERPDLSGLDADIVDYIEALEAALDEAETSGSGRAPRAETALEPSEPPTTMNIISISRDGMAKRTPRHLYFRQRRGGMGVFDIETPEDDPPAFLAAADESAGLVLITNQARAFRLAVRNLPEMPVRGRGESVFAGITLRPNETLALAFADAGGSHVALISARGQVRRIAAHYFGQNLQPGTVLYDVKEGGPPAAACWTTGDGDLFLATQNGQAIRFSERQVPVRGCLGMRVDREDAIIGAAAVYEESGIFLVTDEGKGTIRLMSGFSANKAPGSGGKTAIKAEKLVGVAAVSADDDLFLISRLGKVIRFEADEVPAKEGVVQGVNCMNLRADSCTATVASRI